eukprot:g12838.t1
MTGCNRRYNEGVAATYEKYGGLVARNPLALFLVGLVLAIAASIGLLNLQTTNDVLDIWMYKGTRLDGEKDFYETHFGGGPRGQNVMVSSADGGNAATPLGLTAMQEGVSPLIPGGEDEITFERDGETFGVADTCESATVPSYFKPYTTTTPIDWIASGAFMSYGYRWVSLCAKAGAGTGPVPLPSADLPEGWGIDRFPCSRLSPLDCFQEGMYDYPEALQQLQQVAPFVAGNNLTVTGECVTGFAGNLSATLVQYNLATEETAASEALRAAQQLQLVIQAFATWGYYWRTPYTDMTEAEIVAHLQAARDFAFSDEDPFDCIQTALGGGSAACCLSWAATKLEPDYIFAGADDADGTIKHLLTNQANFPINHPAWITRMEDKGVTSEDGREDVALGWETAMIDEMRPRFEKDEGSLYGEGEQFQDIDLDFFTKRSGDDIIENGNSPEPYLIIIAFLGMVLFAAVSMGAWNFSEPKSVALYSRVLLAIGGMFVVALSTVACLGFISAIGINLTPLSVSVVPFLSLGIGIDDMFIFIYTLVHTTNSPGDPRMRIETTLVHAGPSVTLTSIAVAGCFLVASAVAIDTVRFFAIHMGLQMIFHLILLHLMLLPLMYWDSCRVAAKRSDLLLIKLDREGILPEAQFVGTNTTKRFVEKFYAPLLRTNIVKALVVAVAVAGTAALAWYGASEINLGVGLNTLATEGSFESSFLSVVEEELKADTVFLATKEVELGTYQDTLLEMQDVVQDVKWVSDVSSVKDNSWLADSFSSLLSTTAEPIPTANFTTSFAEWITTGGVTYANNFYCAEGTDGPRVDCTEFDPATTVIKASQQRLYVVDQAKRENNVEMINDMRDAVDSVDPDRDTFAYSDNFALHSQYLYSWRMLFWVVGGGAIMVAVIITVLQGSLRISLLMALSIIMVVLQVFGFLTLLDMGLNGFTIVNLCVMVGLVVEFTAHIGRGFLFAPGGSRNDRVEQTLTELLWPTFAGACTTFLAVLPLTFSKISFFHSYYFQTFAIMTALGFFAGTCFLPVMLSILGPRSQNIQKDVYDGSNIGRADSPMHSSAAIGNADRDELKGQSTI